MARAAHVIGDHSDDPHAHTRGMELKSGDERGRGPGHAPGVAYKNYGNAQRTGAIGRAARQIAGGVTVEKSHDALADADFDGRGVTVPQGPDAFAPHHPCIEIAGRTARSLSMEGRINVVRPAFEPLHLQPATRKRPHQRDCHCCLSLAGAGGSKTECMKRRVHRVFIPDTFLYNRALRTSLRRRYESGDRR